MQTCIIIQGGEPFVSRDAYYASLEQRTYDPTKTERYRRRYRLGQAISHQYQVFIPEMPDGGIATYRAWKIRFEKHIPYCSDEGVVLIGNSLGGSFLCKRLSENTFPKPIAQVHLVATHIDWKPGESVEFVVAYDQLAQLAQQCPKICIYHSHDDLIVPYANAELLKSYLPHAQLITFTDRGHFFQPALPELLERMGVYTQ